MNELGCSFGDLGALLHLMQVNRSYAQVLVGKLLIHDILRKLPGAMDVVRTKVERYPPAVVGAGLDTISSQRRAGLVSHDQPKTAKRNSSRHRP